jgi:hypothetical protein
LVRKAAKKAATEVKMTEANAEWESAVFDAQCAGLTYPEIAALSGKSRVRIDQVIRFQRIARGIPTNHKKGA